MWFEQQCFHVRIGGAMFHMSCLSSWSWLNSTFGQFLYVQHEEDLNHNFQVEIILKFQGRQLVNADKLSVATNAANAISPKRWWWISCLYCLSENGDLTHGVFQILIFHPQKSTNNADEHLSLSQRWIPAANFSSQN